MTDELNKTLEERAEKLALKSKDELLAATQKTFGPGIAAAKTLPTWQKWAWGISIAVLIGLIVVVRVWLG